MKLFAPDFNLEATLGSGQVFGFVQREGGVYEGTLNNFPLRLRQNGDLLYVEAEAQKGLAHSIRHYFDLNRDLSPVYGLLRQDERLAETLKRFKGLRLIRQDAWEAFACFIISSNNNIKRIQGIWHNLVKHFSNGELTFPRPEKLALSDESVLRKLGLGYRAPFLLAAAQFAFRHPLDLQFLRKAPYPEAKAKLMELPGIGTKVADCILLYGFQKYEAFPVDVWVLRVMRKLYFRNRLVPERKVMEFGRKRWGLLAGYIQQYLFHGARSGVL